MDLLQGEHPEIMARIGKGIEKAAFDVQKLRYLWNAARYDQD